MHKWSTLRDKQVWKPPLKLIYLLFQQGLLHGIFWLLIRCHIAETIRWKCMIHKKYYFLITHMMRPCVQDKNSFSLFVWGAFQTHTHVETGLSKCIQQTFVSPDSTYKKIILYFRKSFLSVAFSVVTFFIIIIIIIRWSAPPPAAQILSDSAAVLSSSGSRCLFLSAAFSSSEAGVLL